ncbi:MAG: ribonuclease E/G [Candidatus Puniceispirillaceae bacterium]
MAEENNYLLVDDTQSARKIVFFQAGRVAEFWHAQQGPELGEVHLARVVHLQAAQRRATGTLQGGTKISWRTRRHEHLDTGQLAVVTLTAFGWQDKPMQASAGAQLAGRYSLLILTEWGKASPIRISKKTGDNTSSAGLLQTLEKSSLAALLDAAGASLVVRRQGLIRAALDLPETAKRVIEEAQMLLGLWQEQATPLADKRSEARPRQIFAGLPLLQQAILYAGERDVRIAAEDDFIRISGELAPLLSKGHDCAGGAVIWIEPTRAAVMVDIDSAASNLAPLPLAVQVLPEIFYLLRLRGLAGRVLIDIPYLRAAERHQISQQIESLCRADPRHPEFSGFTPSGLVELRYRYGRQPLDKTLEIL